jgi:hypothetical protein
MEKRFVIPTIAVALAVLSLTVYVTSSINAAAVREGSVPALTPLEIRNPEIATKYGITGYLEISSAPDTPSSLTIIGNETSITFLLHFVSYLPNITETQVTLDPSSGLGLSIQQVYNGGTININDLVSYSVGKTITIKSGEVVPVTLTIHKPANFPHGISFPAGPVGIMANVPIIDNTGVYING